MIKNNRPQSFQIAQKLEKAIFAGKFRPNSPLPSTRKLAATFGVSQQIILSALDRLTKKDVLVRQERRGIYVKARSAVAGAHEILFFAFGEEMGLHTLYRTVNEFILHEGARYNYDFFTRIVSSAGLLTPGRLERELARLENLGFIDCAIFYGITEEVAMKKCLQLPYPVIFLGEVPDSGVLPDQARLISPDSTELLLTAARYAAEQNFREVDLFYWKVPAHHLYERQAMASFAEFLSQHGIKLNSYPVAGKNFGEAGKNFQDILRGQVPPFFPHHLIITQNIHCDAFDDGLLLEEVRKNHGELMTLNIPRRPGAITYLERDYTALYPVLVNMIQNCGDERQFLPQHVVVDYKFKVIKSGV